MIGYHDRLRRQFGRSAQGQYDSNVRVQLIMASELAERIQTQYIRSRHPLPAPFQVLEIGCGTGTLTGLLVRMQQLHHSSITAIDISSAMLEAAKGKLRAACPEAMSRIRWIEADAERWTSARMTEGQPEARRNAEQERRGDSGESEGSGLSASIGQRPNELEPLDPSIEHWPAEGKRTHHHQDDALYDLVVSNACFQWFVQPDRTLAAMRRSMRQGGLLAFTTFGPRTMHELHTSFQHAHQRLGMPYRHHGLSFHSLSSWRGMLQKAGYRLLESVSQEQIETHRSVPDFLHTIKAIGASASSEAANSSTKEGGLGRRLVREMFRVYESFFPALEGTGIAATYETITIVAMRD